MKNFSMLAPRINEFFTQGGRIFRVTYINEGKERITLQFVGYVLNHKVHLTDGKILDFTEFEKYRRTHFPMAHETDRNPENPTLGVHSSTADQKTTM